VSLGATKIFQVGYADFCAIWQIDDPLDWEPPFVVREAGVFIPPPGRHLLQVLTPAELGAVSHPTGNPDEAVLPFPCSLEKMMSWGHDRVGEFSNTALAGWMQGRVRQHHHSMDDDLSLFQVDRADACRLLPHAGPSHPLPTFPCSLDALLQWCDDDTEERPWIAPPSNEGIVRLIKGRLIKSGWPSSERSTSELRTHQRTSRVNIILALSGDPRVDWDSKSRAELHQAIITRCEASHIPLGKGKGGADNIAQAVHAAAKCEKPLITSATPKKDTILKILAEIREDQKAT
jgi:hypothetical protein